MTISRADACRFLLWYQNLLPPRDLSGKEGVLSWLHKTRALQFDPVNVTGRSPDLTLHSRINDYTPEMLTDLLYKDRVLVEHFDKEFCVYPAADWPYLHHRRQGFMEWSKGREREGQMFHRHDEVLSEIEKRGPLNSSELVLEGQVSWYWGPKAKMSRAVLDHLFYSGLVLIHSRVKNRKCYDLPGRILPKDCLNLCGSVPDGETLEEWYVRRRIGSVGLLWNRTGSAWLGLAKTPERQKAIEILCERQELIKITVEDIKQPFYARKADWQAYSEVKLPESNPEKGVFIAPLDNLLWDREMIRQLFAFDYVWEIYKPESRRKWGYYVLPLLYGDRFIGRAEPVFDSKTGKLSIKNVWYEKDCPRGTVQKEALKQAGESLKSMLTAKETTDNG